MGTRPRDTEYAPEFFILAESSLIARGADATALVDWRLGEPENRTTLKTASSSRIEDAHVAEYSPLISPYYLKRQIPLPEKASATVRDGREKIVAILNGDRRKLLVVGPCSIHDVNAAREYAGRLKHLSNQVRDIFQIVMRSYFEKPRTTIGWKGLIYEPSLNAGVHINEGLCTARELLRDISETGLPAGTEFLDPFVPQYIADLVAWGAIGARTAESPQHRQLVSGLSMPVGFKNSVQGDVEAAVNAVVAAKHAKHSFFGVDPYGTPSVVSTRGNPDTHIILRGGTNGTNYDKESVREAQTLLQKAGLKPVLMIDCSHGNSNKDYRLQPAVFESVIQQIYDGNEGIMGLMLESNLHEGNQKMPKDKSELKYGVSITDSCISWETTEKVIRDGFRMLSHRKS